MNTQILQERPAAPTKEMIEDALRELKNQIIQARPADGKVDRLLSAERSNQSFSFEFKKPYSGRYTNKGYHFVLREEHYPVLKQLMFEFNDSRLYGSYPITISDIINACLDFIFEHPLALKSLASENEVRQAIARAIYRKAYSKFVCAL